MIGAGGVATVCAFKMVQNQDVFSELMIASHHKDKCDKLVKAIHDKGYKMDIQTAEVDADDVEQLKQLIGSYKPELVINLALPYQDLTIMDACLACGVNYLDTANYEPKDEAHFEPKDEAHFEYSWQWAYRDRFKKAGLTAILGCGFDPGVSQVFTAYAAKHVFDEIIDPSMSSTRSPTSTSWTATPATTTRPLPQTSTRRSTSVRSHRKVFTTKMANG